MGDVAHVALVNAIKAARAALPSDHVAVLEGVNVQDALIDDWPGGVLGLYATLLRPPPHPGGLVDAAAAYLPELRVVAFNARLLQRAFAGLDESSFAAAVASLARHEWGHALSVTRAEPEQRLTGPSLLDVAPAGMAEAISSGSYQRREIFDELMAHRYDLMVQRAIRGDGYGRPDFVVPALMQAFEEVFPWPPSR